MHVFKMPVKLIQLTILTLALTACGSGSDGNSNSMEPSIDPVEGLPGTAFTLSDPEGRIQSEDLAVFYEDGTDPVTEGVVADNIVFVDSMTLFAEAPWGATDGVQNIVSVRPTLVGPSRFGDLAFFITAVPEPSIEPTTGPPGTTFTIRDERGRMLDATIIVFFEEGAGPNDGQLVSDASFSADGKTAMGTVPRFLFAGTWHVTIHVNSLDERPVFNALDFNVIG